jgi:iron complex transport system permease protein
MVDRDVGQGRRIGDDVLRPPMAICGVAGAILVLTCAAAIGPRGTLSAPRADDEMEIRILTEVRLPRVALGFVAGAALATAGMAFQALFRNPLATPYTLGVSAGASLGAAMYVYSGLSAAVAGIPGQLFAALAGAIASIALVYALARASLGFSSATLLLAGVAVSFLCTSVIGAIQYVGDVSTSFRIGRWLMGGLEVVGFVPVLQLLPFAAAGVGVLLCIPRQLDLLVIGEDSAASRGVAVARAKQIVFACASLMVGGVVSICGPIGFVGLVVPHVGRILLGPRHQRLAPFSVLAGGSFLVVCDTVGRTAVAPVEIPVGIITALIGGPFFIALLVRGGGRAHLGGARE